MKKLAITIIAVFLFSLNSCDKFDSINTDPNKPNRVTPQMLATTLTGSILKMDDAKTFAKKMMLPKFMTWSESAQDEQYNAFGRGSFEADTVLINTIKLKEIAFGGQEPAYNGLALFMKAYRLYYTSLNMGDIPYSEALQGEDGLVRPRYDTQKDVMLQILSDLEAAYERFSQSEVSTFDGDISEYQGDIAQWKKAVTAFHLKVLINLSKKESDAELNIKQRFKDIVNSQPLFTSNNDNFQLKFKNQKGMVYKFHPTETKHASYVMLSSVLTDSLKYYNDYRLFYYASPTPVSVKDGIPDNSWDAYLGVDPSIAFSSVSELKSEGKSCVLNLRYTDYEAGEPLICLGYAEQNFILAEAALRKWITNKTASEYYATAIEAGLRFTKDFTPVEVKYNHGREITDTYIASHLSQPALQLKNTASSFEHDLSKIMTQKYLMSFMQHQTEPYYDYRRTGYPRFPINPATNQNPVTDKIPVRYMYPATETSKNKANLEAALMRQYNGNDDVNELMWILK